ncbi:MAG TPA: HD domain-containing protein [Gemmatimonadales bacterium]|nr:HD domain-containing protein [Gemmatimonadales bacterium]
MNPLAATPRPPPFALGAQLDLPMLVIDLERRHSRRGEFTTLTLAHQSERISTSPFWAEDRFRLVGVSRGQVVRVQGEIGQFNGRRQLKVAALVPLAPGEVDVRRLLPSIPSPDPYWSALDRWRHAIRGPRLAGTVALFFDDPAFRARFESCPASTSGHHAELGGLVRHTWEVAAIGRAIARTTGADADLVLAGALLHDIGKLEAYRWDGAFEMTDAGNLIGHVALGMLMLDRRIGAESIAPCTEGERLLLQHLIASHHGRQEFGAPMPPMTLEAEILHFADNASAKATSMAHTLASADNFEDGSVVSSRTLWELDKRRAYRGRSDWGTTGRS